MKYRVVGWTYDGDEEFPDGEQSFAAIAAIVDNIRENRYVFSGYQHQECGACTPVLNNGKKYCYSQRTWGGIMAQAHGETGLYAYAGYAFFTDTADTVMPKAEDYPYPYEIKSKQELKETFDLAALSYVQEGDMLRILQDPPALRYADVGDAVLLPDGAYGITAVDRRPDMTDEKRRALQQALNDRENESARKQAEAEWLACPVWLILKIEKMA